MCALVAPARADNKQALALFHQGRALATAGDYEGACKKFSSAFALEPSPGTELNLGDCHEHLGHLRTAHEFFEDAKKRFERRGETSSAELARKRSHIIAERLGTIVVAIPDPTVEGLIVRIDGRVIDLSREVHELVDPGEVTVTAEAPGRKLLERHATVASGATTTIDLSAPEEPPAPAPIAASSHEEPSRLRVHLAYGFGAGALATAAGALAFGFTARSRYDAAAGDAAHCDPGDPPHCDAIGTQRIDHAHDLAAIGTGLAVTSGALAIAAVVLYVTAPRDVIVAPSANGVAILGRF